MELQEMNIYDQQYEFISKIQKREIEIKEELFGIKQIESKLVDERIEMFYNLFRKQKQKCVFNWDEHNIGFDFMLELDIDQSKKLLFYQDVGQHLLIKIEFETKKHLFRRKSLKESFDIIMNEIRTLENITHISIDHKSTYDFRLDDGCVIGFSDYLSYNNFLLVDPIVFKEFIKGKYVDYINNLIN